MNPKLYNYLINELFHGYFYQYHKYFKDLFFNYACRADHSKLNNDIEELFSKFTGIPAIIGNLTFEDSSIYENPESVKNKILILKNDYYNLFNYYIRRKRTDTIIDISHALFQEIEVITFT